MLVKLALETRSSLFVSKKYLKGAPFKYAPAFPTNIRLGVISLLVCSSSFILFFNNEVKRNFMVIHSSRKQPYTEKLDLSGKACLVQTMMFVSKILD